MRNAHLVSPKHELVVTLYDLEFLGDVTLSFDESGEIESHWNQLTESPNTREKKRLYSVFVHNLRMNDSPTQI